MKIKFPYEDVPPLEVPEHNLMGAYRPQSVISNADPASLIRQALAQPFGSPTLPEMVTPKSRVLIICDDYTRPTPASEIVPFVLDQLHAGGVTDDRIEFIIAAGTHTRMTAAEIEKKLGPAICARHKVHEHRWRDKDHLAQLGQTDQGTEVYVNRLLLEMDLVMGIGYIVPHRVTGFSGSGNIISPGVAGPVTIGKTHWLSALYAGTEILGQIDNAVRADVNEIARRAGLRFILNVVLDDAHRIAGVFAGDLAAAHRPGCARAREIYGLRMPEPADIVVIDSYPADSELWQAAKGLYAAELAVKPGGAVILVTPCTRGVAPEHPEITHFGYRPVNQVKQLVESGEAKSLVMAAHLGHVGRIIREKATGIMVSSGIAPDVQEKIGFVSASTPQDALAEALRRQGRDAKVAVFSHGAAVLPLHGNA